MMLYVICLWIVLRYIGLNEATRFSAPSEGRSPEHQHTNTTRSNKLPKPSKSIYIEGRSGNWKSGISIKNCIGPYQRTPK